MIQSQRVIFSDNGTLKDISLEVNDYTSSAYTLPLVASEDYIYIGSDLPFNSRYIDITTANDQASSVSVAIWWGNEWVNAVDVIDRTASSGITLVSSNVLQFTPNKLKGWDRESDSEDVTGLTGSYIYDFYWVRLAFSDDLKLTTAINYIGWKFSKDSDLYRFYPDFNNATLKTSFAAGKTDWDDQSFAAAEYIISDLKDMNIIFSPNQILDWESFQIPSIHKTAEIICQGLGSPYNANKLEARNAYKESIKSKIKNIDKNRDALIDDEERQIKQIFMTR